MPLLTERIRVQVCAFMITWFDSGMELKVFKVIFTEFIEKVLLSTSIYISPHPLIPPSLVPGVWDVA